MLVRGLLLVALLFGLAGAAAELLLLGHYEDPWQIAPLGLILLALGVLGWYLARPAWLNALLLRTTMTLFLLAGVVGIWLHMGGAAEFQREIDPAIGRWPLFVKVMRAKAPPALAPGLMIQLGLVGLIFTFTKGKHT